MRTLYVVLLTVFAVSAVFFASADAGKAQPTECEITVVKVAEGSSGEFLFVGEDAGGPFSFTLTPGVPSTGFTDFGEGFVNEVPQPGWRFAGIECDPGGGVLIEATATGWIQNCVNAQQPTFCTIFNEPVSRIPTLSQWG
ncbi:MAG: hypothetical protein ACREN0_01025, partial [Thermodesulfobacteriota bacterium]